MLNKLCDGESIVKDINEYKQKYKDGEFYTLMIKPELIASKKSTVKLRNYFNKPEFYFMVNQIFENMLPEEQIIIKKIFLRPLGLDPTKYKNIDEDAYTEMVRQLIVEENSGKGDCFFIALADAINLYNSRLNEETQWNERIVYNNYGKNIIFTQKSLRTLVANIIMMPDLVENYINIGEINAENLNNLFKQQLTDKATSKKVTDIKQLVDHIYTSNDNFLVKMDPLPEYTENSNPFRVVTKEEIMGYVESPYYWADNTTIEIILKELGLNVIVIENQKNQIQLPFPNLKKENQGTKYVFFYYENAHYELITFSTIRSYGSIKRGIIDYSSPSQPPIYLLFLLFSLYYILLTSAEQQQIELFAIFFKIFNASFNNIYKKALKENKKGFFIKRVKNDSNEMDFLQYFNQYFNTNKKTILNKTYPLLQEMKGGATKKEESMLSYYITIELELQKGDTITDEDINKIKCRQKWNNVRKSYAKITNKKYVIPPVYDTEKNKTMKNRKIEKKENKKIENKKIENKK